MDDQSMRDGGESVIENATRTICGVGEQVRTMAADPVGTAHELARNTSEQASAATDALYRQSARAGEYLTRNVSEYPLTALLVAGAVG